MWVVNWALQNVFYKQSHMESAFTYNLGSTFLLKHGHQKPILNDGFEPVWPDLGDFSHFGHFFKAFGNN